jgi:hypothetical protein
MRPCYLISLILLSAAGCKPAIAQTPSLEERVQQLQAQVEALQGSILHLVVEATGEDLGVSTGGFSAYLPAANGVVVTYSSRVRFAYDGPNCTGRAVIPLFSVPPEFSPSWRWIGVDDTLYRVETLIDDQSATIRSLMDAGISGGPVCREDTTNQPFVGWVPINTGISRRPYPQRELSIRPLPL